MVLPTCPHDVVDENGAPRFGTYQGLPENVAFAELKAPYALSKRDKLLRHKRWMYAFVATPEVTFLCSVANLNYTSNSFALVLDRAENRVLVDHGYLGLTAPFVQVNDQPGAGFRAHFRIPGVDAQWARPFGGDRYHLSLRHGMRLPLRQPSLACELELQAAGAPPPLTVIAPVDGGTVNVTTKWAGLTSFGTLTAGGKTFKLDGGVGGFDYTNGLLARHTTWRWAFACGRLDDGSPVGLNLAEGVNEAGEEVIENALWLKGALHPLKRARFRFEKKKPMAGWEIETDDGAVNLRFTPLGMHRESRDLKVVKSYFVQPVGYFEGTLKIGGQTYPVSQLAGVTEDQDIIW